MRYIGGTTVILTIEVTDNNDELVDAEDISISLYDITNTAVLSHEELTHVSTGTYKYNIDTRDYSNGYYYFIVEGSHGGVYFKEKGTFSIYS